MESAGTFNYEDLITMNKINSTIAKMNECLDNVKQKLFVTFGETYERDYARLKRIADNNQYYMWSPNVIGENGEALVVVGFNFDDEQTNNIPMIMAGLYIDKVNSKFKEVKELDEKEKSDFCKLYDYGYAIKYAFEKPLSDFISSEKQTENICEWFEDKINKVKAFVDNI